MFAASRFGVITLGLVLTLALGATSHVASARLATSAGGSGGRCQVGQLNILPDGSSGGAGHVGFLFRVFNHSAVACTLYGYPGGQLLNAHQRALPTTVTRGLGYLIGKRTPRLVHLVPGASGYFVLEWTHIPSPGQRCPLAPFIRITPPNDYSSIFVPIAQGGIDACGGVLIASPLAPQRIAL